MENLRKIIILSLLLLSTVGIIAFSAVQNPNDTRILAYTVNSNTQDLQLYWKNDQGEILKSIQNLKSYVESKKTTLLFAMNGGMFTRDHSPKGLFIQNNKTLAGLDTTDGEGNFYLKPNGVFYVTNDNIVFKY